MAQQISLERTAMLPRLDATPVRAAAKAAVIEASDTAAPTRSTGHRPGTLDVALSMQDDLSALLASLQRRRDGQSRVAEQHSQAWVDHVLDEDVHNKLAALRQSLQPGHSGAQVLARLQALFTDPSDVLAVLRAFLADEALQEIRQALQAALDLLLDEHAAAGTDAQLRGGLNVAVKARLAAQGRDVTARQLRQSYRELLAGGNDCIGQYARWIVQYRFAWRTHVVSFMEQAVAADMYALDPSGAQLEFGTLLRHVRNLSIIRSADQLLLQHCANRGLLERLQAQPEQVIGALLDVVRGLQPWSTMFAGPMAAARVLFNGVQRSQWIQGLRRAAHALPDGAWDSAAARRLSLDDLESVVAAAVHGDRQPGAGHYRSHV